MTENALIAVVVLLPVVIICLKYRQKLFSGNKNRKRLEKMCFGDKEAALRLMRGEISRNPGIDEDEACRKAVEKLRRHRK